MRAVGFFLPDPYGAAHNTPHAGTVANAFSEAVRYYCQKNGHQLVGLFTPGAGQTHDDVFRELAESVKGRPALVLVPDATHLAPDLETLAARLLEIKDTGSEVRCLDPQYPDIVLNALQRLGLHGPVEARLKRVRKSVLAKAARGQVLGRTPYGYSAGIDGQLKPLPAEADVVRRIFALYTGVSPQGQVAAPMSPVAAAPTVRLVGGMGLRRIAVLLNSEGGHTRRGLPWTPVAVAGILRNRAYVGVYARYGNFIGGAHHAIVDRNVFNQAQALLQGKKPVRRPRRAEPFLLGGLIRCGVCGAGVFGLTRRRTWTNRDGARRSAVYRYYECRARAPGRPDAAGGPEHPSWHAEDLERQVQARLGQQVLAQATRDGAPSVLTSPAPQAPAQRRVQGAPPRSAEAAGQDFVQTLRRLTAGKARLPDLAASLVALRAAKNNSLRPADGASAGGGGTASDVASLVERITLYADRVEVVAKAPPVRRGPVTQATAA
jgi:hypothetical protein